MGWTFLHLNTTPEDYIRSMYTWGTNECLDVAKVGNTYYAAVRSDAGIFAHVVLTSRHNRDYFNFGYKPISEDSGPCETQCPARILKLLTPTEHEWAKEWRRKCWQWHNRVRELRKLQVYARIRSDGHDLQLTPIYRYNENPKLYWLILDGGKPTNKYVQKTRILHSGWEVI